MKSPAVEKWIGIIDTLSSNGDGLGVLTVKIADDVVLKTWNNAVSDMFDHTLIDPDSSVFRKASSLKVGQRVAISGAFIPDLAKTDSRATIARRSLALRPAHSRHHQFVTRQSKTSATSLPP
jgi:hypothetical protein